MKIWVIGGILLTLILISVIVFSSTGGRGLLRIIPNYLLADIPDKRYTWSDFIANNESKRVSGFYSTTFSDENTLALWTLAGLKRFDHAESTSVYYHRDSCGIWKKLVDTDGGNDNQSTDSLNPYITYIDMSSWKESMKQEYLVTVQWLEQDGKKVIDKLWSLSGKYKVIGRLESSVCEN